MGSKHVDTKHHPDEQEGDSRDDDVANPLADGSGLGAIFQWLMVSTSIAVLSPEHWTRAVTSPNRRLDSQPVI